MTLRRWLSFITVVASVSVGSWMGSLSNPSGSMTTR